MLHTVTTIKINELQTTAEAVGVVVAGFEFEKCKKITFKRPKTKFCNLVFFVTFVTIKKINSSNKGQYCISFCNKFAAHTDFCYKLVTTLLQIVTTLVTKFVTAIIH